MPAAEPTLAGDMPKSPWSLAPDEVLRSLRVAPHEGLSDLEHQNRLGHFGPNTLRSIKSRSPWSILVAQFRSLLVLLLLAAVLAAIAFGEWIEAGAILGVLLINTLLGFLTELRGVRAMESLRQLGSATATVRRAGQVRVSPARDLVPGDIVLLEGGDIVSADLRILEASKLQANESTLTGESLPVGKSAEAVQAAAPLAERSAMLFKGTTITRGAATAVVVATGARSEVGQISTLVQEATDELTPLERRLNRLGQGLLWVTLLVASFVAISGYLAGKPLFELIETAIALAVATVPEGLPVIATITLARGMHRMARHHALVNRLSAVETLGATRIICTDKTGTLTENEMHVVQVCTTDDPDARRRLHEVGVLCNNGALNADANTHAGDPLEVALLRAGRQEGIEREMLLRHAPEVFEHAFEPEIKMMATAHGFAAPFRLAVKGAPEAVLAASTLSDEERRHWQEESERLAAEGLRVLALAERQTETPASDPYGDLTLLGLVGMHDPPRAGVQETIASCHQAGVRVVMATGDHPRTALSIATALEMRNASADSVLLGDALEGHAQLPEMQQQRLRDTTVFARVSPKQKLDLIALHQASGSIVAMTGDGVNDAPALRQADIGVAMGGKRSTAAAREAAAIVLRNDNLDSILVAIAEGRAIFDNIRNFAIYLLSCNVSEVMVVGFAAMLGAPLPLLPLQILFLNMLTDVFPALALGVGEGEPNIMKRPPRPAKEPILAGRHWRQIGAYGLLLTASVLVAFALALRGTIARPDIAVTVSFLTLAFGQLFHVFNMRRISSHPLRNEVTRNPWLWGALALCTVLLLAVTYVPPAASLLGLTPPQAGEWGWILGIALAPTLLIQLYQLLRGLFGQHGMTQATP